MLITKLESVANLQAKGAATPAAEISKLWVKIAGHPPATFPRTNSCSSPRPIPNRFHPGSPKKSRKVLLGNPGNPTKSQEITYFLGEPGRTWENLGELGRTWENLGEPGEKQLGLPWADLGGRRTWADLGRS